MNRGQEKRERRAGRERKPTHAEAEILRLRTLRIGPAFPEAVTGPRGPRKDGRGGKDTKAPWRVADRRKRP